MPLIQGNAKSADAGFYTTEIDQSLRFNDDDSAYLSRTPSSAGNRKTWTWSGWVKRGNLGKTASLMDVIQTSGTNWTRFHFNSSDKLAFAVEISNVNKFVFVTNQVFRDTSAWYHIVATYDSTQATSTDRFSLYVNGEKITSYATATYGAQNTDSHFNSTYEHTIAATNNGLWYNDCYLAEVNFIDGTALDATSFGEFKSGVWIPKAYEGSYGTNGFYLPLTSDANDASGNGNNFTENNLASTDYVLDSPTNNFATLNPLNVGANSATYAEGNLKVSSSSSNGIGGSSTIQIPSTGKWYAEFYYVSSSNLEAAMLGISPLASATRTYDWNETGSLGYYSGNGNKYIDGSGTAYGSSYTDGDIISILANSDSGEATYYKNGVSQGVITFDPANKLFYAGDGHGTTSITWVANFGQDSSFAGNKTAQGNSDANGYGDFYYAPPTGYLALCTANLPDPVASIDPAQDGSPQDHFNTVTYTGTGSTQSITGVGFQPDWVWGKRRDGVGQHGIYDAVRGATLELNSASTNAEVTTATGLTSFDADGFSLGSDGRLNTSSATYVAWNWKANGSGVSNTDGSITSKVSANTESGFSIVSYTGNGSSATVGHGLNEAPEFIIYKRRDASVNWICSVTFYDGSMDYNFLNTTAALANSTLSLPTNSVFNLVSSSYTNVSGSDTIAYCFHSVEGFSKFGSYTGNGSADGPFVYTGFRPAFVMVKRTDSAGNWIIHDTQRNTYNVINNGLYPNTSGAENTGWSLDFTSNGFKQRTTGTGANASGGTYIYACFSENPFKYSLAR